MTVAGLCAVRCGDVVTLVRGGENTSRNIQSFSRRTMRVKSYNAPR